MIIGLQYVRYDRNKEVFEKQSLARYIKPLKRASFFNTLQH